MAVRVKFARTLYVRDALAIQPRDLHDNLVISGARPRSSRIQTPNTTLAVLGRWPEPDSAVWASVWRAGWESGRDCPPDSGQGRLRRPSLDSFSPHRPSGGGAEGRRRPSSSSARADAGRSRIGPRSGRGRVPPSSAGALARTPIGP